MALLIAGLAATSALAATPSTLTGEELTGQPTITNAGSPCPPSNTVDGASHTFSYTVAGVATGPYPGTFTENGTVTFSNTLPDINGNPGGQASSWNVSFRINSVAGQIVGYKRVSRSPGATGLCGDFTSPAFSQFRRFANGILDYGAVISVGPHTYVDYGTSEAHEGYYQDPLLTIAQFSETYESALRQPIRIR